ncbi:unnamed protein product [Caenorhabditis nigoni]
MQQAAAIPFNPSRPLPLEFYANELNRHILGTVLPQLPVTNISKEQVKLIEDIVKNIKASHTYFLETSKNPKSEVQVDELQKSLEKEENENSTLKEQVMELTKKLCKMESGKENQSLDFGNKDKIKMKAKAAKKQEQIEKEKEGNDDKKRIAALEAQIRHLEEDASILREYYEPSQKEKEENDDKKRIKALEAQIRHLEEDASILREYYEPSHFLKSFKEENEDLKAKILEKKTEMDRVMAENQKLMRANDKALEKIDLLNENIEKLKKNNKNVRFGF